MTDLQNYTTVNSSSKIVVAMSAVSHVIEHDNKEHTDSEGRPLQTCWVHFHSGKSVHVDIPFSEVNHDLGDYFATRAQ